jgi:hypothetical protein
MHSHSTLSNVCLLDGRLVQYSQIYTPIIAQSRDEPLSVLFELFLLCAWAFWWAFGVQVPSSIEDSRGLGGFGNS